MAKLCIMYLSDAHRLFGFPFFVQNLSKCKYLDNIELLILSHSDETSFYQDHLSKTTINYKIAIVPHENNYMRKIAVTLEYMSQHNIPYIMKHDNDIHMSPYVYDYMFENLDVLNDTSNLLLTPTLTSGIPTVDLFIKDYLTEEESKKLGNLFLQYNHGPLWGTDYTHLNKFTKEATTWDSARYYEGVKQHPHAYKGIHPVRMYRDAILQLNQYVIEKKDRIFQKDNYSLHFDSHSPYFCNSVFCMKADLYRTILSRNDLFVDMFDEVPINKWRDLMKLNIVIIRNGVAVHPMYNTIDHYIEYEKAILAHISQTM